MNHEARTTTPVEQEPPVNGLDPNLTGQALSGSLDADLARWNVSDRELGVDPSLTGESLSKSLDSDLANLHDQRLISQVYADHHAAEARQGRSVEDDKLQDILDGIDQNLATAADDHRHEREGHRSNTYNRAYFDELGRSRDEAVDNGFASDDETPIGRAAAEAAARERAEKAGQQAADAFDEDHRAGDERYARMNSFGDVLQNGSQADADKIMDQAFLAGNLSGDFSEYDGYYGAMTPAQRAAYEVHSAELQASIDAEVEAAKASTESRGRHAAPDGDAAEATSTPNTNTQTGGRHSTGDRTVIERIVEQRPFRTSHRAPEQDGFKQSDFDPFEPVDNSNGSRSAAEASADNSDIDLALDGDGTNAAPEAPAVREQRPRPHVMRLTEYGNPKTKKRMSSDALHASRVRMYGPDESKWPPQLAIADAEALAAGVASDASPLPPAADLRPKGFRERVRDMWYGAGAHVSHNAVTTGEKSNGKRIAAAVVGVAAVAAALKYGFGHDSSGHLTAVAPTPTGTGSTAGQGLLTHIPPHATGSIAGEAATIAAGALNKAHEHLVNGFDPNVVVPKGGGYDHLVGQLAGQKGFHLTSAQEQHIYEELRARHGNNWFASKNGGYEMANGGAGISAPGAHEMNHAVLHDLDNLLNATKE